MGTRFRSVRGRRRSLSERFWEKVDKRGPDECWPWLGYVNTYGYGRIGATSAKRGPILIASRASWELHHGRPMPAGLWALHTCDNPRCVNPAHLYAGTRADNVRDMYARGRANRPRGERHCCARFSEEQVREIRAAYAGGGLSQRRLGELYGVSHRAICNIVRRRTWAHI